MIKVITTMLDSEKYFYSECIDTQRSWANRNGMSYEIYSGFHVRDSSLEWIKFAAFYESLRVSNDGDQVIFLAPSIYIMDDARDPLKAEDDKIKFFSDPNYFCLDFISAKRTEKNLQILDFMWGFSDTEMGSPEFAMLLASEVFDDFSFPSSRKGKISISPRIDSNSIEVKAITWKDPEDESPMFVIKDGYDGKSEYFYKIGDFSVNLGNNKYIAKELSYEFKEIKRRITETSDESRKIYRDIASK